MIFNNYSLDDCAEATGTVVVIDVLRAFSCTAFAFGAGVNSVWLVGEVEQAFALGAQMPDALLMGEVGSKRVEGFDFGNSPAELVGLDLRGRRMIQRTSNGTQGMVRCQRAQTILAGSFCCARSTVDFIRRQNPSTLSFVITGYGPDGRGDEDVALAEYMAALLRGESPDPEPYLGRVRNSVIGRRFPDPNWPDFPPADLPCCTDLDRFDFAMPVERRDDLLVMTRGADSR
ncbi:MAG: 2-phosphosulfolactate phosphatase [Caldilineaceae bacterium]|nr:2-phosphosulfolactate phosphatase [Caldilineaceae bacterium]